MDDIWDICKGVLEKVDKNYLRCSKCFLLYFLKDGKRVGFITTIENNEKVLETKDLRSNTHM